MPSNKAINHEALNRDIDAGGKAQVDRLARAHLELSLNDLERMVVDESWGAHDRAKAAKEEYVKRLNLDHAREGWIRGLERALELARRGRGGAGAA